MADLPCIMNMSDFAGARLPSSCRLIGRPTRWGNPFVLGRDGDRAAVIAKHRAFVLTHPDFIAELEALRGYHLVCPGNCKPAACHGDLYLELLYGPAR